MTTLFHKKLVITLYSDPRSLADDEIGLLELYTDSSAVISALIPVNRGVAPSSLAWKLQGD